MRNILRGLSENSIQKTSQAIVQQLTASDLLTSTDRPLTVAIYAANGPEPSLQPLHQLMPEIRFVYPLCHPPARLSFHHVTQPTSLTPGMLGISEPDPQRHPEVATADIDIFLCPGLLFGKDGSRLGHGAGYYDRALEGFGGLVCGIAPELQIRDTVPHENHDITMEFLISDTGITATKPR